MHFLFKAKRRLQSSSLESDEEFQVPLETAFS